MSARSTVLLQGSSLGLFTALAATALAACGGGTASESQSAGGSASTTTASAGTGGSGGALGQGGDTLSIPEGGGPTTSTMLPSCDPAPPIDAAVSTPVPGDATADFAALGTAVSLSMAPDGDAVLMFGGASQLYARRLHAGQWSEYEQIASPSKGYLSTGPRTRTVAAGPDGRAVLMYGESHDSLVNVCVRLYDPASGWSEPQSAAAVNEGWWQDPSAPPVAAAMNSHGDAVVVWPREVNDTLGLSASMFVANTGSWTAVQPVSVDADLVESPAVVLHEDGRVVIAWPEINAVRARAFALSSGWSDITQLADGGGRSVALSIGADQSTVALWSRVVDQASLRVETATLPKQGTWSAPAVLDAVVTAPNVALATGPGGAGVAAWHYFQQLCEVHAHLRARSPDGTWLPVVPVPDLDSSPTQITGVAANDAGDAAAVWTRIAWDSCVPAGTNLSRRDPLTGDWLSTEIDPEGDSASVAISPDGRALVAWERWNPPTTLVRWLDPPAP